MRYRRNPIENLEGEVWKPIAESEGRYEVSNYGRVKSLLRTGPGEKDTQDRSHEHIIRDKMGNRGYKVVSLAYNGRRVYRNVHRLVAAAFLGIPEGMVVNHIDGCKTNNNLSNLEVTTYTGNLEHAIRTGLSRVPKNPLKPIAVYRGGVLVGEYPSIKQACESLGLNNSSVSKVLTGHKKSNKGYTFKYL